MMTDAPTAAKRAAPDRAIRRNWLANGRHWPANRVKFREATLSVMKPKQALEFKGRMLSLTRARVVDPDLAAIPAQLPDFARQMPQAVQGMPIVLEADVAVDPGGVLATGRGAWRGRGLQYVLILVVACTL